MQLMPCKRFHSLTSGDKHQLVVKSAPQMNRNNDVYFHCCFTRMLCGNRDRLYYYHSTFDSPVRCLRKCGYLCSTLITVHVPLLVLAFLKHTLCTLSNVFHLQSVERPNDIGWITRPDGSMSSLRYIPRHRMGRFHHSMPLFESQRRCFIGCICHCVARSRHYQYSESQSPMVRATYDVLCGSLKTFAFPGALRSSVSASLFSRIVA